MPKISSKKAGLRALLASIAGGCIAQTQHGSPVISSGAFVTMLGSDTISVETFRRTRVEMTGQVVRRIPSTSIVSYTATIAPNGLPARTTMTVTKADGYPIPNFPRLFKLEFGADTTVMEIHRDTVVRRVIVAKNGMLFIPESYAFHELWLSHALMLHHDSGFVTGVAPLGGPGGRLAYRLLGDTARAWILGSPLELVYDRDGRLLMADGNATTIKYIARRISAADVSAVALSFAKRDAMGRPFGVFISPRDTVRAKIGGAAIWVDYGRPLSRGRDIFAYGVLGDTLWRTGANAATQIESTRTLSFAGKTLPAGRYTLWTRVKPGSPAQYELVFNSQTGQWGTQHDSRRDLFSVPLKAESGGQTEQFTISILSRGQTGSIELAWGPMHLSTDFTVL